MYKQLFLASMLMCGSMRDGYRGMAHLHAANHRL